MKLENQVCSLELAKKLKELGVKQEGVFIWDTYVKEKPVVMYSADILKNDLVAFTAAELGEMLPENIDINRGTAFLGYGYHIDGNPCCFYKINGKTVAIEESDTEANARTKMLIWLIENGHIKNG